MAAIIFDLDGTIADSFDYVVDFLTDSAGQERLENVDKRHLRGVSMVTMARQFGVAWWRLPLLFYRGRRSMSSSIKDVKPFEGMQELIQKLHAEGHELFLVSSNSLRNVRKFLHQQDLHTYFLELYGGIGLFSKAPTLRKLVRENNLDMKNCVYVGDELRDVQAAQSVDMRVIAVSWGFAKHKVLKASRPTALAETRAQLLTILEKI